MSKIFNKFIILLFATVLTFSFTGHSQEKLEVQAGDFAVYVLKITTSKEKLAAWQVELHYDRNSVKIVGIEGGNTKSFPEEKPAYYDPKGLTAGKIILANFCTIDKNLASGSQIVAKLHVMQTGKSTTPFQQKKNIFSNNSGKKINAKINLTRMETK